MSADNVVIVQKRIIKERKRYWCVWHQSASCPVNPSNSWGEALHFKRRRDAIMAAHKLAAEIGYVEYGVTVL